MQSDPSDQGQDALADEPVQEGHPVAAQACASCRKQKRKCDKRLPSCGLCLRIGRTCDYTGDPSASTPSAEEFAALRQQVENLQNLFQQGVSSASNVPSVVGSSGSSGFPSLPLGGGDLNSPTRLISPGLIPGDVAWPGPLSFPSLFFLDSSAFEYERFQVQAPLIRVPPGALSVLGSSAELRATIEEFFVTIHLYFPIISKIRLYQHLASPLHEPGADIALLFLSMKLITTEISEGSLPRSQLYNDVKSMFRYVEAQNGFSIQTMQALQLITLYEIGHAIWPAAYLSAGHAARLGHAMGLHDRGAPQMLVRPATWTEQEERRRVWWGVTILESYVNLGHRAKPFATSEPSVEMHLPVEDCLWDKGQMDVSTPLSLSASQTTKAAPFARTCQAAHILSKICRHLNDTNLPVEFRFTEALQLDRTVRSFAAVLPDEARLDDPLRPSRCASLALCYSAVLTLYDAYSCTERAIEHGPEEQLQMQKEAIGGIAPICDQAYQLALRVRAFAEQGGLGRVSIFVIDAIYQAAANYAWLYRESSNLEYRQRLTELKDVLNFLDQRWKCAGQYNFSLMDFWERAQYDSEGRYIPSYRR